MVRKLGISIKEHLLLYMGKRFSKVAEELRKIKNLNILAEFYYTFEEQK